MKDSDKDHVGTPGTYVINAIYTVIFILGFLYMFFELSQRWPVH